MNQVQKKRVQLRPLQGSYKPPRGSICAGKDLEPAPQTKIHPKNILLTVPEEKGPSSLEYLYKPPRSSICAGKDLEPAPQTKVHPKNILLTVPEEQGPSSLEYLRSHYGFTLPREENIPRMDKVARQKLIRSLQKSLQPSKKTQKQTRETSPWDNWSPDSRNMSTRSSDIPTMPEIPKAIPKHRTSPQSRHSSEEEFLPPLYTESYEKLRNTLRKSLIPGAQRSSVIEEYFNLYMYKPQSGSSLLHNDESPGEDGQTPGENEQIQRHGSSSMSLKATSSMQLAKYGSKRFQRRLTSELKQIDATARRRTITRNISLRAAGHDHITDTDRERDEELAREVRHKLTADNKQQRQMMRERNEAKAAKLQDIIQNPQGYYANRHRGHSIIEVDTSPAPMPPTRGASPSMPVLLEEPTPSITAAVSKPITPKSDSNSESEEDETSCDVTASSSAEFPNQSVIMEVYVKSKHLGIPKRVPQSPKEHSNDSS